MKLKHISLIFSITGIAVLYFISTLTTPYIIELNEVPNYEGKIVTTQGIVINHYETKHGSQIITIQDKNTTVTIFLEGKIEVEYGDKLQITGEIKKYKEEWEIIPSDAKSIKIIQKWDNISIPLWQIAQNPSKYENININITGFIDSVFDNYFILADEEGKHSLMVFYNTYTDIRIFSGQKVNIAGSFKFDKKNFRYMVKLNQEGHKISFISGD